MYVCYLALINIHNKMTKIVLLLLQVLLLSSCDQGQNLLMKFLGRDEKELITLHSEKSFYIDSDYSYVVATGIWKVISGHDTSYALFITNGDPISLPHTVEIVCDKNRGNYCSVRETIIGIMPISDMYYLTTNEENSFRIKTWDKDMIIAINNFRDSCLSRVLYMDINTQEVLIKSIIQSKNIDAKYCATIKGQSMPIIHKLVDYHESPQKYYITLTVKPKSIK